MNRYNWKGYDFIGTVPEFAEKFGYCKTPTFVNAIKRVPRYRYNCMGAMEQRVYEEKRKRAKRAYCIYMNEDMTESYIITKEEYPSVRWKMQNLQKLKAANPKKLKAEADKLRKIFGME